MAGAGYVAYFEIVLQAPVRVYRRFADAWAMEDTPAALALTDGGSVRKDVESKILRGVCMAPMESLRGARHDIESRRSVSGGDVVVTAREYVFFNPPGIESALIGAMVADVRHVARLRKTGAGWRVVAWTPEFLGARSTRPH